MCHSRTGAEARIASTQHGLFSILDKRREQYAQADLTVSLEDAKGADMGAPVAVVTYRYQCLYFNILRIQLQLLGAGFKPLPCRSLDGLHTSIFF